MNKGFLALWFLIAAWFLTAIIWFAVDEIKERKKNKKNNKKCKQIVDKKKSKPYNKDR